MGGHMRSSSRGYYARALIDSRGFPYALPATLRVTVVLVVVGSVLLLGADVANASSLAQDAVTMPVVTEKMRTYSHLRYALYFVGFVYACGAQLILMTSRFSARVRDWAERGTKKPVLQFLGYMLVIYVALFVLMLPFSFLSSFYIEHQFDLTHQSFVDWCIDTLKHLALGFFLTTPLLGSFFWLVRKFPKRWPIFFALASSLLIAFVTFISPIVLEPVMNKFTPMQEGTLRDQIKELATKAGAPEAPVLVADKSKQTDKLNAYVSGLGQSTHIVIWDTTLSKLPHDQVLAIVGHELGHYYLKHVLIGFLLAVGVNILCIPINMYLARPFVAHLPFTWGVRGLDDFAVVPVLVLVVTVTGFFADPLINAWSRKEEHEADAFSIRVTGNGPALARSMVSLSERNLSEPDPHPLIKLWLFSHPTLKERIEFGMRNGQE